MRLLSIVLCAISVSLYAQDNVKSAREGFKLSLAVDGSAVYESDVKPSPYLNGLKIIYSQIKICRLYFQFSTLRYFARFVIFLYHKF